MSTYQATIKGVGVDWVDPVFRIIIDNGVHQYEFDPADVDTIEITALPEGEPW